MAIQTYLVDAFIRHAASTIAACTVLRSLEGGVLPLCGLELYDKLGLGWEHSTRVHCFGHSAFSSLVPIVWSTAP
jgi:hypothetical protein